MVILPLVERELRAATRRPRTYWVRVVAAAATVLLGAVALLGVQTWQAGSIAGRDLFRLVSSLAFLLCLFAGLFTTSLCLSEERRHGTLELLFLTDLRPLSVVLGKLATASLNSLQTLLGAMPVLAVCFVLGGVSVGEFWRMGVVLLSTLFFSLAVAMFVSALSQHPDRAMLGAAGLTLLITTALAALDRLLVGDMASAGIGSIVPGPYQAFAAVWDDKFKLPPENFWHSVLWTHALSWHLLWQASRTLSHAIVQKSAGIPSDEWRERLLRWITGEAAAAKAFRRRWLRRSPSFWLASRRRWHWLRLWTWLGTVSAIWLAGVFYVGFSGGRLNYFLLLMLPIGLQLVVKVAVAAEAAWRLHELRRNGGLELLLVTPLSPDAICRGHVLALKRQFAAPLLLVLSIDAVLLVWGGSVAADFHASLAGLGLPLSGGATVAAGPLSNEQEIVRCLVLWGLAALLVVDARALAWMGLWQGVLASTAIKAVRVTLYRVLVRPVFWFLVTLPFAPPLLVFGLSLGSAGGWLLGATIWWLVIGIGASYAFCLRARREVVNQLRWAATFRYGCPNLRRLSRVESGTTEASMKA